MTKNSRARKRIAIDTYCERDSLIESCIRFIFTSTDVQRQEQKKIDGRKCDINNDYETEARQTST